MMGRVVSRAVIVSFLLSEFEEAEWIRGWGQDVVNMDDGTERDESSRWDAKLQCTNSKTGRETSKGIET